MKICFKTTEEKYSADYMELVREFEPHVTEGADGEELILTLEEDSEQLRVIIKCGYLPEKYYTITQKIDISRNKLSKIAQIKRVSKVALYDVLKKISGVSLPYGSLTGIRPTKLFHDMKERGLDAERIFREDLRVSEEKTSLVSEIVENQSSVYLKEEGVADVFVNIPICPTRCVYCSFISAENSKVKRFVPRYCELLREELEDCRKLVSDAGYKIRSVYVGGGTPTCIPDDEFESILSLCDFGQSEFTVEAGRPDTITDIKLKIMDKTGVTRISINPQSFNQSTLDAIGRRHTVEDIYRAYAEARRYSFDINTDLIAMLPGEGFDEFRHSVDEAIRLSPENITVHTLALKKGSVLKVGGYDNTSDELAAKMVDYARAAVGEAGYAPYYMYRQKYVSGNLENVGYAKIGKFCVYNVDIMEETTTIVANGAGGISKKFDLSLNLLERCANPKGLDVYLARGSEVPEKRRDFFIGKN